MICINGVWWDVQFVSPDDEILLMPTGWTIGVTDWNTKTIYVADNLSDEMTYNVLIHELCHCIIFSYGYQFNISDEECICQIMEQFSDDILDLADKIYETIN